VVEELPRASSATIDAVHAARESMLLGESVEPVEPLVRRAT